MVEESRYINTQSSNIDKTSYDEHNKISEPRQYVSEEKKEKFERYLKKGREGSRDQEGRGGEGKQDSSIAQKGKKQSSPFEALQRQNRLAKKELGDKTEKSLESPSADQKGKNVKPISQQVEDPKVDQPFSVKGKTSSAGEKGKVSMDAENLPAEDAEFDSS
ncbi:MAG: hypothetical protein ACQEP8_00500, partial [Chlamydiota bacterium]